MEFDLIKAGIWKADTPCAVRINLPDEERDRFSVRSPYVLEASLATAINTAIAVDQPLLVTGEPGCGKTALAWAIAARLGTEVEAFYTKSTSVARDLLYSVDSVRRFHDASMKLEEARDPRNYISFQALGRAFRSNRTRVVLIDEIDKAPRDFPNDLLRELEQKEFTIPEIREPEDGRVRQKVRHVIVITSNGERPLSSAFLRRCVYAHIPFPEPSELLDIALVHAEDLEVPPDLVEAAIPRFVEIRGAELVKKPATSELLAWLFVLHRRGITAKAVIDAPLTSLPGKEVLLKVFEDREQFQE